ncbi:MAG: hypothetical protein NZL96_01060 [Patescibacteria group bacterium]|nr:hypothetical protein [Patescibacteria group bacterium]
MSIRRIIMSLTEFSYYIRRVLPVAIIFVLLIFTISYFINFYLRYLENNKPKPVIAPKIFGKIRPPQIKNATSSGYFSFLLDTIEGQPITTTDSARVYFVPKPAVRFGYREKILLMAKTLGFDVEKTPYSLVDNIAIFEDENRSLEINITNFNFKYESFPDRNLIATSTALFPSEREIENKAIDFLKRINRYPDELAKGMIRLIYIKYDPVFQDFVEVKNREEANVVEVDFYRQNINERPVFSPSFFKSQNYVIMTFNEEIDYEVIKAQVAFFERSDSQYDLYPIKSADLAWEELIKGKGKVVAATEGQREVAIKKIDLGYYDFDSYQSFLQPVYLFLGDNNFAAYVEAIPDQWLVREDQVEGN